MKLNDRFLKCLVIVPHQDDEINLAAGFIHSLRKEGTEVYIAYSTNGDWKYSAEVRVSEAIKVADFLGDIPKDHIILLGYGDSFFDKNESHIFYCDEGRAVSHSGHSNTYGACDIIDYSTRKRGRPSNYNRKDFCEDLIDLIKDIKADLIICSDYDEHPDHRMLSLGFDYALGRVLAENKGYYPRVLKGFAYCNSYCAVPDFNENPFRETMRPQLNITDKYEYDIIDTSIYRWDERVQIFMPESGLRRKYISNLKARALAMHFSQPILFRADRIINSDEVFWERRTDSISYSAKVSATSGNAAILNDFILYNTNNIDENPPSFTDHLWLPSPEDSLKEAVFEWADKQEVSVVCLYGDINNQYNDGTVSIRFDNGYSIDALRLPEKGNRLTVSFEKQNIKTCTVSVTGNIGLAECEFYADVKETLKDASVIDSKDITVFDIICNKLYILFYKIAKKAWKVLYILKKQGLRGVAKKISQKVLR